MNNVFIFLARGFEESEAIVPADLLKRAGANIIFVATEGGLAVTGARGFTVTANLTIDEVRKDDIDAIILPGGALGTEYLSGNMRVLSLVEYAASRGIHIGAICAAPSILGDLGLLEGRNAAVYPGFEDKMKNANITGKKVEYDDIFITADGMGSSFEFGFKLVEVMFGAEKAEEIRKEVRFK